MWSHTYIWNRYHLICSTASSQKEIFWWNAVNVCYLCEISSSHITASFLTVKTECLFMYATEQCQLPKDIGAIWGAVILRFHRVANLHNSSLKSYTLSIVMLVLSTFVELPLCNNLQQCCHIFMKNCDTLKSSCLQGALKYWKARSHWEPNVFNKGGVPFQH